MELSLFWTEFSQKELEGIYNYYSENVGIQVAKKIINGIYNETLKLKSQPKIGQVEELLKSAQFRRVTNTAENSFVLFNLLKYHFFDKRLF